jgi:putative ABC transport system permease protein
MKRMLRRVRALFRKNSVESELDAELQFHLDHQTERHVAAGLTPEEARYRALRDFGGVAQVEERCRDTRRVRVVENLWQDARYGVRQMLRNPGFAAAAVATLALGIGASTALVSIANQVLLRPLPFSDPDTLMQVWQTPPKAPEQHVNVTPSDFYDFRAQTRSLSGLASIVDNDFNWTGSGEAVKLWGSFVSANILDVLGVQPVLGRGFRAEEDQPGKPLVVLLSHGLWNRRFGASQTSSAEASFSTASRARSSACFRRITIRTRPTCLHPVFPRAMTVSHTTCWWSDDWRSAPRSCRQVQRCRPSRSVWPRSIHRPIVNGAPRWFR